MYNYHESFANSQEFQIQTNLSYTFIVQDETCPFSSSRHCAFISFDEKSPTTMFNEACEDL
jgi:hypothetical protein